VEGAAQLIEDLVLAGPRAAAANLERWLEAGRAARQAALAEIAQVPEHAPDTAPGPGRLPDRAPSGTAATAPRRGVGR
jgi:hypothetical protein